MSGSPDMDVQISFSTGIGPGFGDAKRGIFPYKFFPQSSNPGKNFSGGLYIHLMFNVIILAWTIHTNKHR
jgi:hypothetical protein